MSGKVVVDSQMCLNESLIGASVDCPPHILRQQCLLHVEYLSFDGNIHQGQILVHREVQDDVKSFFEEAVELNFKISTVIPLADKRFSWSDDASMDLNNSSGFNFRYIAGTSELSMHAFGKAFDINPRQNPCYSGKSIRPLGGLYDPRMEGTLFQEHPLVVKMIARGWTWGGTWKTMKDYHHFEFH